VSRATRWIAALALVVALVLLVSGGPAHGDPTDDKRAQARVLQAEIDANGARIGALSEQYNGAQYRLEQAQAAIADAEQKLVATEAEVERLRALVNERGAALYRGVGQGGSIALDVSSANSLIASSKYSTVAAEHDTKLLDDLRRAERALRDQRAQAEQARAEAEDEQREIVKTRASVEAANAQQEQLLSGLTMRAWGAAGVSMPHYSGAQYSMFPKVPLGAMQPGDLVFWGPGGSQHVGPHIGATR
jgi:hypothetical protein